MKVLLLELHLSTGGAPQFALKRIKSLLKFTNIEVYCIELNFHGADFVVQRNKIKALVGDRFYEAGENKMRVMDIINIIKPDIVHIEDVAERLPRELANALYSNDRTYRIAETPHDVIFNPNQSKIYHPDLYLFCTPYHTDAYSDMESKFEVIEYPIEFKDIHWLQKIHAKKELGMDLDKKHVLNVGLWTKGKNQGEMLEIALKYPDIQFHSVGNQAINFADYWQPLMQNVPVNVKIWGERADIDTFMNAADIFMFNSINECAPLVLKEALSNNLPIVSRLLPSYPLEYADYLYPIDADLNTIDKPKSEYVFNNDSSVFALRHETCYDKILKFPIRKQKVQVINHFVHNPFLEIKGISDSDFKVQFFDENGSIAYENTIKSNHWIKLNRQYYTKWRAVASQDGEVIYDNTLALKDRRVYIAFESKALGDTLAWVPYVFEFQKKHECTVICSTFWNRLFDEAPNVSFVEPGTTVSDIYALYRIGYFYDLNKIPVNPVTLPLQKVATTILGLDYKEIVPKLAYIPDVPKMGRYVTIATNSTAGMKFWGKEHWQTLINWLVFEGGYEVYNVSLEPNPFDNCIQITTPSLESKMDWIAGSEFFVGLSSGLAWIAYALRKPVYMIANFTEEWNEFKCNRITNKNVCHGCWNNPNFRYAGEWDYCPIHKGTDRQWECQLSITADMVIEEIKKASV
jgi:autotransporter strand-loop-strand O-heptosyltransferase